MKSGLPRIADSDTRLFILGSLPGDRSIEAGQYYAHSTNHFWKLLGALLGDDLAAREYPQRLALIASRGIGLWDVIHAAQREGSQDSAIRDARHNSIHHLQRKFPQLEAIAFNGGKAAKEGRRLLADNDGIELIDLISSSGMAAVPFASKVERWRTILRYLK